MNSNPCIKCKQQGCGAFHDECELYQEWMKLNNSIVEAIRADHAFLNVSHPSHYRSAAPRNKKFIREED